MTVEFWLSPGDIDWGKRDHIMWLWEHWHIIKMMYWPPAPPGTRPHDYAAIFDTTPSNIRLPARYTPYGGKPPGIVKVIDVKIEFERRMKTCGMYGTMAEEYFAQDRSLKDIAERFSDPRYKRALSEEQVERLIDQVVRYITGKRAKDRPFVEWTNRNWNRKRASSLRTNDDKCASPSERGGARAILLS